MIFSVRQLQEKCIEQKMDLYQIFVDLNFDFDIVDRNTLWKILKKFECSDKFVSVLKGFHEGIKAHVNLDIKISYVNLVENSVKQGGITVSTRIVYYYGFLGDL